MTPDGTRLLMLVDDEPAQCRLIAAIAGRAGFRTIFAREAEAALATLGTQDGLMLDAIAIDNWVPGGDAVELIGELKTRRPALPILMLTANGSVAEAVAAMRAGATDYLVKPIAPERLAEALTLAVTTRRDARELRPMTEKIAAPLGFDQIVGSAPAFRAALAVAAKAARARVPVLIEGEGGAGKEVLADAIQAAGTRAGAAYLKINCGAIAPNLIDSALFGHVRGAFTGAFDDRAGLIEQADGGTLFLDEVDRLGQETQARLLRFLKEGEVQPIGATRARIVDLRLISASNRSLARAVEKEEFREDLYYRLNIVQIRVPPLRERRDDVPALARHFLRRLAEQPGLRSLGITDEALALLRAYDWPGNVRQLQSALFRAAVLCEGDALTVDDLPQIAELVELPDAGHRHDGATRAGGVTLYAEDGNLRPLDDIEADVIRLAIGHYRGRMTEVARRLGIGRSTLYRKLSELGIDNAA